VFPAIAVADELRSRDPSPRVLYVGKRGGLEERAAASCGLDFQPITVAGWARVGAYRKVLAVFKLVLGLMQAFITLARFRPQAVLGTGGYVSFPVVAAAILLRIPTVIHEQNRYPGLANKVLGRFVRRIAATYEDETRSFPPEKCSLTGMPLRRDIVDRVGTRTSPTLFGLDPSKCTVFLLGGSQGAHSLNLAMTDAMNLLDPDRYQLLFMTGKHDLEMVQERAAHNPVNSYVAGFFEDIAEAYASSDLVVCRAGASTLAELTAFGLASILVPYPYSAGGHQEANSRVMVDAAASRMILDSELDGAKLAEVIEQVTGDAQLLDSMRQRSSALARPHAASEIADILLDTASRRI
jgi:UDP-N-acetylglucosamine--N-acetylmuramyl-(pentapeptide) pyrophosphoryl-undecaprenol N-acetylglucosamine transferase